MSTEEQKPVVAPEAPVVEATPTPVVPEATDKPVEAAEPKAEEPAKTEGEVAAPVEEKKKEEPVEPITHGALGYKAPGLKNAFRYSKKYFWFSEEPVSVQSLNQYLRGEKAEVAHPTAAWSNQSGKGLLYFVKHADEKAAPAGVLNLSEATDLSKDGTVAFHFKLHGHKHAFEAQTAPERNGWFVAVEKAIEEGKAAKEGIVGSETYKEELAKLGKPATLAATAAKEGSTPKKSTDVAPKLAEPEASAAEASVPARAGSSSSSSSGEDKKKTKAKSKSRSVSRGKRTSLFGGLLGKKDKVEEKVEAKKEEHEAKKEEETPAAAPAAEASTSTAPVIPAPEGLSKPIEEPKTEEAAAPAIAPVAEEKKAEEEKPKPTKRGSIFGNFVEKLRSPTTEKKESEIVPAAPAKEPETATEAPKLEEAVVAPVAPAAETTVEAPQTEETKETKPAATTPHKEKQSFSFGKFLGGNKEKTKASSAEKAPEVPKTEEPAKVEEPTAPAAAPVEPVAEAPKTEEKKEETPAKAKRGSIFGNLIRNASKASKPKKEEKPATTTPAKVEETAEPTEAPKEETPVAPAAAEPATIGDVVPEAVSVGQDTKSTPQVSTTA